MTSRWLLKTEPAAYAYQDLQRDGHATWDGVRSAAALIHLRAMRTGDHALIYHSGAERAVVGVARVTKGAYPDPLANDPKRVVVDLAPVRVLQAPVPLSRIKADPLFANFGLVRISRLSVMPVSPAQWDHLVEWGGR
jgi:predicted RNA-binding protein with PUA-like domain